MSTLCPGPRPRCSITPISFIRSFLFCYQKRMGEEIGVVEVYGTLHVLLESIKHVLAIRVLVVLCELGATVLEVMGLLVVHYYDVRLISILPVMH